MLIMCILGAQMGENRRIHGDVMGGSLRDDC